MATLPVAIEPKAFELSRGTSTARAHARAIPWSLTASRTILSVTLLLGTLVFGAVEPWTWGLMSVLVAMSLLLWALSAVRRGAMRLFWTPLYVPAATLLLIGLVQRALGLTANPTSTREALIKLALDALIFFLACQLWHEASSGELRRLGFAVTLCTCGLALFSVLQFFASPGTIYGVVKPRWGGWIFGPYVNHNHYAGLMEMLIPVALGYLISSGARDTKHADPSRGRSVLVRLLGPLAVLVAVASVLLSGSRGGMVSLAIEAVIAAVVTGRYLPESWGRLAVVGILGIAASAAFFFWLDPGRIAQRLGTLADVSRAPEATLGQRRELSRDALRIFIDHPWIGTGFGSFATVYPRYRSFASDLEWDHAHDDYAEALAETGLAGGMVIVTAISVFLVLSFGNLRERLRPSEGWIRLGAAIGCCGLLVHSLGDFNLHIPANAAWFAFLAGIAVCHRGTELSRDDHP